MRLSQSLVFGVFVFALSLFSFVSLAEAAPVSELPVILQARFDSQAADASRKNLVLLNVSHPVISSGVTASDFQYVDNNGAGMQTIVGVTIANGGTSIVLEMGEDAVAGDAGDRIVFKAGALRTYGGGFMGGALHAMSDGGGAVLTDNAGVGPKIMYVYGDDDSPHPERLLVKFAFGDALTSDRLKNVTLVGPSDFNTDPVIDTDAFTYYNNTGGGIEEAIATVGTSLDSGATTYEPYNPFFVVSLDRYQVASGDYRHDTLSCTGSDAPLYDIWHNICEPIDSSIGNVLENSGNDTLVVRAGVGLPDAAVYLWNNVRNDFERMPVMSGITFDYTDISGDGCSIAAYSDRTLAIGGKTLAFGGACDAMELTDLADEIGVDSTDTWGNVLDAATYKATPTDTIRPVIASVKTENDRSLVISFTKKIDPRTVQASDLSYNYPDYKYGLTNVSVIEDKVNWYSQTTGLWNTDATGLDAGTGTDADGVTHTDKPSVSILEHAVTDVAGNDSRAQTNFTGTTDGAGPALIDYSPVDANNASIYQQITFSFSEALDLPQEVGEDTFRAGLQFNSTPSVTNDWDASVVSKRYVTLTPNTFTYNTAFNISLFSRGIFDLVGNHLDMTTTTDVSLHTRSGGGGGGSIIISPNIAINGGDVETHALPVVLSLFADGADEMMISNRADMAGGVWETYDTVKNWTLPAGEGVKTVYVRYKNSTGSNTPMPVSDSIIYVEQATEPADPDSLPLVGTVVAPEMPAGIAAGSLVKSAYHPAVYFVGFDGLRHVFPAEKIYKSWYSGFSTVQTVSAAALANIDLGDAMTMRPGTFLVKLRTVPEVFAVEPGGVLRWLENERVAAALYGDNWAGRIRDISDSMYPQYVKGEPITTSDLHDGMVITSVSSPEVYYVSEGKLREFNAIEAFRMNYYQDRFIVVQDQLSALPLGTPITSKERALYAPF